MRRRAFLATVGTGTVALAGCLGAGSSGDEYDIGMSSSRFKPAEYAVAPGTTVVWKNTSKHSHTVTAYESGIPDDAEFFASGGFESVEAARDGWQQSTAGAIEQRQSFEHEFTIPGEYRYFCIPHERSNMVGVITVTEDATRTPADGRVTATVGTASTESGNTTE